MSDKPTLPIHLRTGMSIGPRNRAFFEDLACDDDLLNPAVWSVFRMMSLQAMKPVGSKNKSRSKKQE
jgi:hypothetical protein